MTTIAWDGKAMAGDSFSDLGGLKSLKPAKVWKLTDGSVFGGAGASSQIFALRDQLDGSSLVKLFALDDIHAMHAKVDGEVDFYCNSAIPVPIPQCPFAVGSGRDFAIAAMAMGATAKEAVRLAACFDTYTSEPVMEVELKVAAALAVWRQGDYYRMARGVPVHAKWDEDAVMIYTGNGDPPPPLATDVPLR